MHGHKTVASSYLKLSNFLQSNVKLLQWNLSRHQDLSRFDVSTAEEQWSEFQSWERRIAEYQDDLLGIMVQLQVPRGQETRTQRSQRRLQTWQDPTADYQFLYHHFDDIRRRASV